ncbi:MAG: hypothetical protein ACKVQB_11025 [Bacteroidia bacterium]
MSIPIHIDFSMDKISLITDVKPGMDTFEIPDLIRFLLKKGYNKKIKNENIIRNITRTENQEWFSFFDYEAFKLDFEKTVNKNSKIGSYMVYKKGTKESAEWVFLDAMPYEKKGWFSNFKKPKPNYRLARFISNDSSLSLMFYDGKQRHAIDVLKQDLGQLYEAIPINKTTNYNQGEAIEIEIAGNTAFEKYIYDFKELDRVAKYAQDNDWYFRLSGNKD